jgi:PHD/YefM family antitoxin component YafN of YafNO toxin-antitoxin module
MNIQAKAIVSNSEMIKNYKNCRDKAETFKKIFILKNNQPDAILFSIIEYEKISILIEYMENLDDEDAAKFIDTLPKKEKNKKKTVYTLET